MTIKLQNGQVLDETNIRDILTTAFEGGVGYWCVLDNTTNTWLTSKADLKEKKAQNIDTTVYLEDIMYDILFNEEKAIELLDAEDEGCEDLDKNEGLEGNAWLLTKDKLISGLNKFFENKVYDEFSFDANDADCIIQYAIFGDLIFG